VNKIDNQYRLYKLPAKERTRVAAVRGTCVRHMAKLNELLSVANIVCLLGFCNVNLRLSVVTFCIRLSYVVPADYYYYYYYYYYYFLCLK